MNQTSAQAVPIGLKPSFGFGDRLGVATAGHVRALRGAGAGITPIFAQQSIREMTRTQRTPEQVIGDAFRGARDAGYDGPQGADADHLKTTADVDRTADAGFCFFTIDPSDFVEGHASRFDAATLAARKKAIGQDAAWVERYRGTTLSLSSGRQLEVDDEAAARAAVKYGKAVTASIALAGHIDAVMRAAGRDYEIELSIDETPEPTTLIEHFIVAHRCLSEGVKLVSLAPRFIGEFEKGIDYKGDLVALRRSMDDHADIARALGPYKLSLHSGSDKLSIYAILSRTTKGLFHVKTAGTSYLEALRAVLRHDVDLFRAIVTFSRTRYESDRATYHVSAALDAVPPPEVLSVERLERQYLDDWLDALPGKGFVAPGRQILHTTFGSVLTHPTLKGEMMDLLRRHPDTYDAMLEEHFRRHLEALQA